MVRVWGWEVQNADVSVPAWAQLTGGGQASKRVHRALSWNILGLGAKRSLAWELGTWGVEVRSLMSA